MKVKFRSSVFPLLSDNIIASAPRKKVYSFFICLLQRQLQIVICYFRIVLVSSEGASHGTHNVLVTSTLVSDCEPLPRLLLELQTF